MKDFLKFEVYMEDRKQKIKFAFGTDHYITLWRTGWRRTTVDTDRSVRI